MVPPKTVLGVHSFYFYNVLKTRWKLLNHTTTTDFTFYKLIPTRKKILDIKLYKFEVSCYGLRALIVGGPTFIVSFSVSFGCSEICGSLRVNLIQLGE